MTSAALAVVRPRTTTDTVLRVAIAATLGVAAVIHVQLAGSYDLAAPEGIGEGNLFRAEAAVAVLAAIFVLVRGSRTAYAVALIVAVSALVAVLLTRYVDLPGLGPIPAMYEPIWFPKKSVTAIAEGLGSVLAVVGLTRMAARRPFSPADHAQRTEG